MIVDLVFGVFFVGFCLLLSVLHIMRALYASGLCSAPDLEATLEDSPVGPGETRFAKGWELSPNRASWGNACSTDPRGTNVGAIPSADDRRPAAPGEKLE